MLTSKMGRACKRGGYGVEGGVGVLWHGADYRNTKEVLNFHYMYTTYL